ncbi:pantothenate kinase [Fructobacillus fructosus]|uniref:type I pantothenate kinase n=1 Tax=Fructobacillus fructosus TaxID=1631 RepID=UPI0002194018|nr:type I pantothenate kinase [Fructobacillus fructosus]KRN52458.1 pantothenate kinase [Fructobacillus fructosus KCTC 3544]GAP01694.1 pantothenate kinase [Fructobacillus fructosus]
MIERLIEEVKNAHQGVFFTIGLTGSVAVGKSTLADQLAMEIKAAGLTVQVLSTDAFLKTNEQLHQEGIFDEKGFPNSYDLKGMATFIENFRNGQQTQRTAVYSQTLADRVPGKESIIDRPDVLILEGVVALQLPKKLLDLTVFLEADLQDIRDWYLARNLLATVKSANEPNSWRAKYADMPLLDFYKLAMGVWEKTNQQNYDRFIYPTKGKADWVVSVDYYHQIQSITPGTAKD